MDQELIQQVKEAIDRSVNWAETGWHITFGPRRTEVLSLPEAEKMPRTFVYREEAVNYWKQVQLTGEDAAASGKKALLALENNNLKAAEDALYFCQYLEKPFTKEAQTWLPVHQAIKKKMEAV
ncbi:MAG: hypothetical protein HQM13_13080 [SAR324 cluster bacterium]|nr:hypothetical protein [SAR324 cluster bacterium]